MAGRARRRPRAAKGPSARTSCSKQLIDKARRSGAYLPFSRQHRVHQHDPAEQQERCRATQAIEHRIRSYVRWNAMAMVVRANKDTERRRPHRELRLGGHALRRRLQPLLARADRQPRRRPGLLPGPLGARHLRARLPARPAHRGAAGQLPPGGRRQGRLVVSASVADAGLLAVPDGVDGPRAAHGDLPGALHEVPAGPRPRATPRAARSGRSGRRRDGRAGVAGRDRHGGAREARQPDLRRQLQPAAPRRPGARQRQDHPGARRRLPRRRLERDQGDLGRALGPAARARQEGHPAAADDGSASTASTRRSRAKRRRLRARAFLRQVSRAAGDGRRLVRRGHLAPEPRRPRSAQGLRRLPCGGEAQGPADGDPRQDHQGLRHGRGGRGAEHHAPAEEDGARVDAPLPRPLQASRSPTTSSRKLPYYMPRRTRPR